MTEQGGSSLPRRLDTTCIIAGCGPAGAMLGLLLARAGIDVVVLEKHADFLRDFRGDTIHPSTIRILGELGLAASFLRLPHTEVRELQAHTSDGVVTIADFGRLRTPYPFVALVPQWDFLEFLTAEAARYPTFRLVRRAEVIDILADGPGIENVVRGVRVRTADGEHGEPDEHEVHALLTVAADGRTSRVRSAAGLEPVGQAPPIDVLWFRLSRRPGDRSPSAGIFGEGHVVVRLERSDYWQIAYVIPKGGYDRVRSAGIETFRASVAALLPDVADRVDEITDWDRVFLLNVQANRLPRWWRPGLVAIGDAAHAMSPVGGVGINLAIQDAVVAANTLAEPLARRRVTPADLAAVQRSRELPTRVIQAVQAVVQDRALAGTRNGSPFPRWVRFIRRVPVLRDVPAQLIGIGVWPVHVKRPPAMAATTPRAAS